MLAAAAGLVAVVSLALPTAASAGPPAVARADAALFRALRAVVARPQGPPGASALVQRGGVRRFFTVGVGDVRTRRRFHVDDHMRSASTGKAFEGAIALRLVDAGRLSLDDTVAQRVSGMPASWGPVTLRQLLHHTSGLPDFTASSGWQRAVAANPHRYFAPREVIAFAAGLPLAFAPGSRYAYSNTDNLVAGVMVEEATGSSYEGQLGAQVLGPLRLRETSLPSTFLMPAPYVHGYDPQSRGRYEDISELISSSATWAAGGFVTTPADLNRFIRAWGGPRFVRSATRAAQLDFVAGRRRAAWAGPQRGGSGDLPLPHSLRGGAGPHRQLPRLHAVHRQQPRWAAVDRGVGERATGRLGDRTSRGLPLHARRLRGRRVRCARALIALDAAGASGAVRGGPEGESSRRHERAIVPG